jgi:hypothetical protein
VSTREVERAIRGNDFADDFFRGRRSHPLRHHFGSGVSGKSPGIELAIETRSAFQFLQIGRGLSMALMIIVGGACGLSAMGLARNADWGRRLALALLMINLIGDSLTSLLRHHPRTLIGVPIGTLLIWYLLRRKRARI